MNSRILWRTILVLLFTSLLGIATASALPKVLVLGAEDDDWGNDVVTKLTGTGQFSQVDWFNCISNTPTLSDLQAYDGVLAFTDYSPASGTGDVLAQYIDGGGHLVLCMFAFASSWSFDGNLMTDSYLCISADGVNTGSDYLAYTADPSHPIMSGVSSFDGGSSSYRSPSWTVADAYIIAYWSDESPIIAARDAVGPSSVRRVDLNFFPVSSDMREDFWQSYTDGALIMANALTWTIGGVVTHPQLSLQPKTLNFGAYNLGTNGTLCVTATNVGDAPLTISDESFSGTADYELASSPEGNTLGVGGSADFCIRFTPHGTGLRNGTFTLTTDGRDSGTQSVNLTGIGASPEADYTEASLFQGSRVRLQKTLTKYLHVTSSGSGPLVITDAHIAGPNADNYSVVYLPAAPIPSGHMDSIGVRFAPNFEGRPDAALVVNSNAYERPSYSIPLLGIGVLPRLTFAAAGMTGNTVRFDSVALGDSLCASLSLYNSGTDTVKLLKQLKVGGDFDFSFYPLSGNATRIPPGGTQLVNVCFKPLRNGTRLASFGFYSDIPLTFDKPSRDTSQFIIQVTGVGVPFGKLIVTGPVVDSALVTKTNCVTELVQNTGLANITVTQAYVTGPTASQFTLTSGAPFSLAPGQSKSVSLCFTAMAPGYVFDTITLLGTNADRAFTLQVPIAGYGTQHCALASKAIAQFGDQGLTLVGTTAFDTISVSNCGDFNETYTAQVATGQTHYTVTPASSGVIAPGASTDFIVRFMPTAIGLAPGTLQILGGETPQTVVLNGVGAGVTAIASGQPAGTVTVGDCDTFSVTITNTGNIDWTPGAAQISGPNASEFSIVSEATPATIAMDGSATVVVRFCPTSSGSKSITLTFPNAAPAPLSPGFSYAVTGTAAANSVASFEQQDGFILGQTYPNPATTTADLVLTTPRDASVRIELVDLTGATLRTVFTGPLSAGKHILTIDAKNLPSGTYFYTLTSGNVRLARQFMLMK